MARILTAAADATEKSLTTRIGGRPLTEAGFAWPVCRSCSGPMRFLAQVRLADTAIDGLADGLLLVFQCGNDPGMCDDWDPDGGGNAAVVARGKLRLAEPPSGDATLLDGMDGTAVVETPGSYEDALEQGLASLGQLGGEPLWIQDDETPTCGCGARMTLAVQLECEGGGGLNFGDLGSGYGFVCTACGDRAKFLWQCT